MSYLKLGWEKDECQSPGALYARIFVSIHRNTVAFCEKALHTRHSHDEGGGEVHCRGNKLCILVHGGWDSDSIAEYEESGSEPSRSELSTIRPDSSSYRKNQLESNDHANIHYHIGISRVSTIKWTSSH